jgi:hypothetical protein
MDNKYDRMVAIYFLFYERPIMQGSRTISLSKIEKQRKEIIESVKEKGINYKRSSIYGDSYSAYGGTFEPEVTRHREVLDLRLKDNSYYVFEATWLDLGSVGQIISEIDRMFEEQPELLVLLED